MKRDEILNYIRQAKILGWRGIELSTIDEEVLLFAIKNLPQLETLILNNLTFIDLLSEIRFLRNLRQLIISGGKLKTIPNEIGELTRLETITINNLDGLMELPSGIGKLENLTSLDISNNKLEELPVEIGLLKSVKFLDLSKNNLREIPSTIDNLQNLKTFHLWGNHIIYLPSISSLNKLESLSFNSDATDKIPDSIFGLQKLILLDLGS